jgi:hypothetical protein
MRNMMIYVLDRRLLAPGAELSRQFARERTSKY